MRIHWFQHHPLEGLAAIAPWLAAHGHTVRGCRLDLGEHPQPTDAYDALIVMGGPMSVHDHRQYPWLATEKAALRDALAVGKRVLGICLGAQLLADALGGRVSRNAAPEIGWFDVRLSAEGRRHPVCAGLPPVFTAFHWHEDGYTLPPGAVHLAASEAYEQQGFVAEQGRVVGWQFHLEVTPAALTAWLAGAQFAPAAQVQGPATILADQRAMAATPALLDALLSAFFTPSCG